MNSFSFAKTAGAILLSGFLAVLPATADVAEWSAEWSNDVVKIRSLDGTVTLTGELESFSDGVYIVKTKLGTFFIEVNKSTCEGPGCPFVMA